jgi:hypothetical protein
MARTMKAAVVRAFGERLAIEEVPVPTPGAGQILVKICTPPRATGRSSRSRPSFPAMRASATSPRWAPG